jgi:hypothetical protein
MMPQALIFGRSIVKASFMKDSFWLILEKVLSK